MSRTDVIDELCIRAGIKRRRLGSWFLGKREAEQILAYIRALEAVAGKGGRECKA